MNNNEVSSQGDGVTHALKELLEIASYNHDEPVIHWIQLELGGYYNTNPFTRKEDIPDYRRINVVYRDEYDRPIHIQDPKLAFIQDYEIRFSVGELEAMSLSTSASYKIEDVKRLDMLRTHLGFNPLSVSFERSAIFPILETIQLIALDHKKRILSSSSHMNTPAMRGLPTYFHEKVRNTAEPLFQNGHYRQAVLDVFIALVEEVKVRSGKHDMDGKSLMQHVFSVRNPVLRLSTLSDEQEGLMHLFEGAVQGIRNPKAHSIQVTAEEEEALQWLGFASALFRRLDTAILTN